MNEIVLSSHRIGQDLEDQVEQLLRTWGLTYRRGHAVTTDFGSRFTVDFWLPTVSGRLPVVIECKNFGVAAKSLPNSRTRKAQEVFYLLAHVRRYCAQTKDSRIILVTGAQGFLREQTAFLSTELGPDFHVTSIHARETLRALIV